MWGLHLKGDSVRGEADLIAAKRGTGPPVGSARKVYMQAVIYRIIRPWAGHLISAS